MRQRRSLKPSAVRVCLVVSAIVSFSVLRLAAQSCETSADLDEAARLALTTTAQRDFDMAAKGDTASLRQKAAASLAADFSGIEAAVKDHQKDLASAKATVRSVFLLSVDSPGPLAHGEFYCGVFGKSGQTANSAVFYLDNLQPGKYGVVILDAASSTTKDTFSIILEQSGSDWKLGGLYIRSMTIAGHDVDWLLARAREYKSRGQVHNAWFYFLEGRDLASPLNFMSTAATDKLYDESQNAKPADLPADGKSSDLAAGAATYKLTAIFPQAVGDDLDLVVKYQVADVSNTSQAYQNNVAVMKALLAKYPELKDAFAGVVARAVDPSGRDYGTLLAMKDVK
jgi:hypothetical protein